MTKIKIDFVSCPNEIHINQEGWFSRKLFYIGNNIVKCDQCKKEFSIEIIIKEIERDSAFKKMQLTEDYRLRLAQLELKKQELTNQIKEIAGIS